MKQKFNINKVRGFSLLEVLVTIVLLAVGFLVAGKMQVQGLRSSQSAQLQANVLQISAEMVNKMRNNPVGVANGHYDGKTTAVTAAVTCANTGCTPAQVASLDLFEWSTHFIDLKDIGTYYLPSLPGADADQPASASISEPVDGVYTISVNWHSFQSGELVPESFTLNFIP